MKKIIQTVIACLILIALVLVLTNTTLAQGLLKFLLNETKASDKTFNEYWYYSQLTQREKDVYMKLATAVENMDKNVTVVGGKNLSASDATKAYEAYMLDNPECFYVSNKYEIVVTKLLNVAAIKIKLDFTGNKEKIETQKNKLELEAQNIINKVISSDMTDFEKQLALHDYLLSHVNYYDYTNIEDIPNVKHTAYGALVDNEAVCDGISKAYSILLKKCGIENVVVIGKMSEQHAWNKVCLAGNWYNVDVTADACGKERTISHVYFNLTDAEMKKSHTFDLLFSTPECNNSNDYYDYYDYKITNQDILGDKVSKIIANTKGESLEFKINSNSYTIQNVVQKLYELDFNKYKTNNIKEMKYYYIGNVFVIPKNK